VQIDVFLSSAENARNQQLHPATHLSVNTRLLVWRQRKHSFQTCCGKYVTTPGRL